MYASGVDAQGLPQLRPEPGPRLFDLWLCERAPEPQRHLAPGKPNINLSNVPIFIDAESPLHDERMVVGGNRVENTGDRQGMLFAANVLRDVGGFMSGVASVTTQQAFACGKENGRVWLRVPANRDLYKETRDQRQEEQPNRPSTA